MHDLKEILIRMQPYPLELKQLCNVNSEFAEALKSTHPEKFVSLGAVIVSHCPLIPEDEIVGFLVYDYGKNSKFKQDFIVNVGGKRKEFIIYTRFTGIPKSKIIQDISHFYKKYPTYPLNSHHPKYEDLPIEFQKRADDAMRLSQAIINGGLRKELTDEEYRYYDSYLKSLNL